MQVSQILQSKGGEITTVAPDTPILDIAKLLKEKRIGAVVVLDGDERIAGILSERDIVRSLADHGETLAKRTAADLMTREVETCKPSQKVDDVMRVMTEKRFRHVPVVDKGKLVGIISIGDAVKARIEDLEYEANVLHSFITQ